MWIAPLLPLFLGLVLIPDPGASQFGAQMKACRPCHKHVNDEDGKWLDKAIAGGVNTYQKCSHLNYIRYQLNTGQWICAPESLQWVKQLTKCIDEGTTCQTDGSSRSQKEFSKGTNEKPSTTTIMVPTTAVVTSVEPSTQSRDDNVGQSTEPAKHEATRPAAGTVAPNNMDTTSQGSNKENINLANQHQGNDKVSENANEVDDGKMKHMKTAIISLVGIVLVLVAVSVGLYCRRRNISKLNVPCGSGSVTYMPTPDSINAEP